MPDAQEAESSTAIGTVETESPNIAAWSEQQYDHWRQTGEPPPPSKPNPEESAPSSESAAAEKPAETAPASEPAKQELEGKGKALKARNTQLDEEIKGLQERLARRHELRQELAALDPGRNNKTETPAPEDGEPKASGFASGEDGALTVDDLEKFLAARDAWRDRQAMKAAQQKAVAERGRQALDRINQFSAEHDDYDAVVNSRAVQAITWPVQTYNALEEFLRESEAVGPLTYHLAKNIDVMRNLSSLSPVALTRELTKIELSLTGSGKPGPVSAPSPKVQTSAPPPPTELPGRNAATADEEEQAVADGDFERYKRAMDAKDLKRKRA